ncbi:MAG TPA: glycosyltransferase family 1 protein [Bacteroidales bacterium]|nr:glycosyltransferase family 4 protein [Bacteroidales bacterium]HNV96674.1 glycosyltransferase family 1 protein [Bacteroidales bacterium]
MIIAFDAKRAFFNNTGLGNYSRNTLHQLFTFYPEHHYWLYVPSKRFKNKFTIPKEVRIATPNSWVGRLFPSYWRSLLINSQLMYEKPDIYHGLSNELPFGITSTKIKTVVTIHDLIFKRFPQWYKPMDVKIYDRKFSYAAQHADMVIAVSQQTANDIEYYYNIPSERIRVLYQSCNPLFFNYLNKTDIDAVLSKYNLPSKYLLYVGTIEERKNLHRLIEALHIAKIDIPLVVIGRKTAYFTNNVLPLIEQYKIQSQLHFLENVENSSLPAIYQAAKLFIYPSLFEGFGIPILEAQASGTPVLTSTGSCFSEAGGPHSAYANPLDSNDIAQQLTLLLNDKERRISMIEKGRAYAQQFNDKQCAENLMKVYEQLLSI